MNVWARDDAGFWGESSREITMDSLAGEYVMTDLGAATRVSLSSFGHFTQTVSGCFGAPRVAGGTWSIDEAGIRLEPMQGGDRTAANETLDFAVAAIADGYALVPGSSIGSFLVSGPDRTNCLRAVRSTTSARR